MEPTYYIRGLLRQANAKYARDYLGIVPGAGNGTVTNALNLANNAVAVGDGGTVGIKTIASLGAAGTVLTSNGAGNPPSFQAAPGGAGTVTNALNLSPTNAVVVADGGTTGVKTLAALGAAGTILTSNGAGVPPSFQAPAAGGNVTTSDTLDDNILIVGTGGVDVESLGSAGTTTTVLHGNAAGLPSFGAVVEADFGFTDITTANSSTTEHGLLPKLSGSSSDYLDGNGNFTIPAEVEWTNFIDYFVYSSSSAAPTSLGCPTANQSSGGGNASPPDATQFSSFQYETNTVINNTAFVSGGIANTPWFIGHRTWWLAYVKPVSTTDCRYFLGVADANPTNSNTPGTIQACLLFRFSTTAGDTNWQAIIGNGTTNEVVDTGVAIDTTNMHRFEIRWDGTNTNSADFYIDGVLVATGTVDQPAATTFGMTCSIINLAAVAEKAMRFAMMKIRTWT